MLRIFLSILLLFSITYSIEKGTIPNTFSGGTRAVASLINENFDSSIVVADRVIDSLVLFARWLSFPDSTITKINLDTAIIDTAKISDLKADTIHATALVGKLTAGATEIEGSGFDINGGDISAVNISGGLTWAAAQNMNGQNLTNVNIDNGTIDGATIGASSARPGTFTTISASGTCDAATVNTGQGDNEVYDMDQNVLSTSAVTFVSTTMDSALFTGAQSFNPGSAALSFYFDTTFACTLTNVTGADSVVTMAVTQVGNIMSVTIPEIQATGSGGGSTTLKGIPDDIGPETQLHYPIRLENGGTYEMGVMHIVAVGGVWTLQDINLGDVNTGTIGFPIVIMTYMQDVGL